MKLLNAKDGGGRCIKCPFMSVTTKQVLLDTMYRNETTYYCNKVEYCDNNSLDKKEARDGNK